MAPPFTAPMARALFDERPGALAGMALCVASVHLENWRAGHAGKA